MAAWRGEKSAVLCVRALEAGVLLRRLQEGESLSLPHSRPLPSLGARCHELRVRDENRNWRIIYRIDSDRILILEVFAKQLAEKIGSSQSRIAKAEGARASVSIELMVRAILAAGGTVGGISEALSHAQARVEQPSRSEKEAVAA